MDKEYCW